MTARSVRILISATTAAAVIAALLWFFVFRPGKVHDPFMLVPGDALMVALIDQNALVQQAAGNSANASDEINQWGEALWGLNHPFGFVAGQLFMHAESGAADNAHNVRPVMCLISEKSANHLVLMAPVHDPEKLTGQMRSFQQSGLHIDQHQGYTRYFWKNYLIAHNNHFLIAIASKPGTLQSTRSDVLAKLVAGNRELKSFHESDVAEQLLAQKGDLVAWISPEPLMKIMNGLAVLALLPGMDELPLELGYFATMNFSNGKINMEAIPVQADEKADVTTDATPNPRHFRHHPSRDLLAIGAFHLPGLLYPAGQKPAPEASATGDPLSGLLGSPILKEIIKVMTGHGVLSVSHKPANLGPAMSGLMAGYGEIEDPFALMSPVVILTLEVDGARYDQMVSELIRRKVLTQEGKVLKIRMQLAGIPISARRFLTFYLHRVGDMAIITNQKTVAGDFSDAGIPKSEQISINEQQMISGTLALDLRMASLYRLFGNPEAQGFEDRLLTRSEKVTVSFKAHKLSVQVMLKDTATSPVFQLLMMLTGDDNRRKP